MKSSHNGNKPCDPRALELQAASDEDLMAKVVEGNEQAFACLVSRYSSRVMNLVYRYLGDRQRAEDIAQEVFLRLHVHRGRYRPGGKFSGWLFTIAMNLAKNEIRSRVRQRGGISLEYLHEISGDAETALMDRCRLPDQTAEDGELHQIVAQAVQRLPGAYREAVVLRDLQGLSYEEIAGVLGIPGGTVRSRINRARILLKRALSSYMDVPAVLPRRRAPASPVEAGAPAAEAAAMVARTPFTPAVAEAPQPALPVVLLVDDEAEVRRAVRAGLVRRGYDVLEAASGEEALRVARGCRGPIALLLADVVMPGMNGVHLGQIFKNLHPESKLLYMSGYVAGAIETPGAADDSGADFIQKPFKPDQLAQRIQQVLAAESAGQIRAVNVSARAASAS